MARPVCSVYALEADNEVPQVTGESAMPAVFSAPIRDDIVAFVHSNMAKNKRQAHGVFHLQGHQHSAESWGTGRAVARIPRISGSGTHRSGQAAFGNQCRKGRMFAPLKIWRKWHRKINTNQKRHAVASALAAAACAPLVMARGHRVNDVPELPLVSDAVNASSTGSLLTALNKLGAKKDLHRVRKSKKMRNGQGKYRYSRFTMRKGPLIIYGNGDSNVKRCARNLPGVDTCNVHRLNLLQLAPGGVVGRFVVFTRDAFESLDHLFGSYTAKGQGKKGYQMQRNVIECADLARIINADQVQSKLRGIRVHVPDHELHDKTKRNPLKNKTMMQKLNPNSKAQAVADAKAVVARVANRAKVLKEKRSKVGRKAKAVRTARFTGLADELETAFVAAHQIILDEIKDGQIDASESEEEESDE